MATHIMTSLDAKSISLSIAHVSFGALLLDRMALHHVISRRSFFYLLRTFCVISGKNR